MAKKKETQEETQEEKGTQEEFSRTIKANFEKMISTGCTLLDLALTGGVSHAGGLPGGILVEIYGESGSGKTAILTETAAIAQEMGGEVLFLDPEARLNREYAELYGLNIEDEKNYERPDTVTELFTHLVEWQPERDDVINVFAADSLAALSTEMEMKEGDKMGMRRAKEFSEGLRKTARLIASKNQILLASNQTRDNGSGGTATPGGKGVGYYASARIETKKVFPKWRIEKEITYTGESGNKTKVKKLVGIWTKCKIIKNSLDDPFREVNIAIRFKYGIDDVATNLQWLKDIMGTTNYTFKDVSARGLDQMIQKIEAQGLVDDLREHVINIWHEVEDGFKIQRKKKRG